MTDSNAFSPNYITARERFRAASSSLGYSHTAYPINQVSPKGEELTIDVAISSAEKFKRVVVISSGLHGVEGFLGSAIQLILLEKLKSIPLLPADTKLVLIHALNPYGFAWRRRWNENNIDLNRNFLLSGKVFEGSPQDYSKFNSFLNPTSPPSLFEPYLIKFQKIPHFKDFGLLQSIMFVVILFIQYNQIDLFFFNHIYKILLFFYLMLQHDH